MNEARIRIIAPSRLHFGLLSWGDESPRQFGSVGLMIESPGLEAEIRPSETWSAEGPLAERALTTLRRVAETLDREGRALAPMHLTIHRAPSEHVGLGTGTQLSLAIARLVLAATGEDQPDTERLVTLTGRGRRSGIGLHGFARGGLLVDGGRSARSPFPPLISRVDFPRDWSLLVVIPPLGPGLAGTREREAFARLPSVPARSVDYLCRLVLLDLLPAVLEEDLAAFDEALTELQREVGRNFAPAQGGLYASPELENIAAAMRRGGLVGVGQSSWGPTLFGFAKLDADQRQEMTQRLQKNTGLASEMIWTTATPDGARLQKMP